MGKVSITAGIYKSRIIEFLDQQKGLRPTLSKIRGMLFNWLGQDLTGMVCLDLFAGSGVLGFESLSRGASLVYMVDNNKANVQMLRMNRDRLGIMPQLLNITCQDACLFLKQWSNQSSNKPSSKQLVVTSNAEDVVNTIDVIYLDPPYNNIHLLKLALQTIACCEILSPDAYIYVEYDNSYINNQQLLASFPWLCIYKHKQVDHFVYTLFSIRREYNYHGFANM